MPVNILHSIAASLAAVSGVLLAGAITDGRSLVEADLNDVYGMGIYQDTRGYTWDDSKHGAHACSEMKRIGQGILAFSIIAIIMIGLSVLVHTLAAAAQNHQKGLAITTLCLNVCAAVSCFIAWVLAATLYTKEFCVGLKLKDHFSLQYGLYVLVVGSVAMSFCAGFSLVAACSRPAEPEAAPAGAHSQEMRVQPAIPTVPVYPAYPAYPPAQPAPVVKEAPGAAPADAPAAWP
eukprot:Rhum_TRINITY_DN14988_c0_g1::Rhum_TRINITY_DN14988_c0_g1_i11::g.131408::m.131408